MKKPMTVIVILIFAFMPVSINGNGLVGEVYAWDDCPKGLVNDAYPGSCPRYVDTDGNGICDRSEPAPEDRIEYQKQPNNNITVFMSLFVPLIIIFGYACIYKIKRKKTL